MSMEAYYKKTTDEEITALQSGELSSYDFMFESENECIGQVWHVLHYAITGSADEGEGALAKAVLGGEPVNDDDLGYGPLLYCSKDDVKEVASALNDITAETIEARLDYNSLAAEGVYLAEYVEDGRDEVYAAFETVKKIFGEAAANDENVVFCIA